MACSMYRAGVSFGSSKQSQRLCQLAPLCAPKRSAVYANPMRSLLSISSHLMWPRNMRSAAVGTESDASAGVSTVQAQQHGVEAPVERQPIAAELAEEPQNSQYMMQQLPKSQPKAHTVGLPNKVLAKLGPLQPAAKAVFGIISAVEPRLRGLILLNIMTFVMGECNSFRKVVATAAVCSSALSIIMSIQCSVTLCAFTRRLITLHYCSIPSSRSKAHC